MKILCLIFLLSFAAQGESLEEALHSLRTQKKLSISSEYYTELPFWDWKNEVLADSRIETELRKYKVKKDILPSAYMDEITRELKAKIFSEQFDWIQRARCESFAKGKFLTKKKVIKREAYSNVEEDVIGNFENGFIKIEASGCLSSNSVMKVMGEYLKKEFQLAAISELKSSEVKDNLICEETEVFGLGTSKYCYNLQVNYDAKNKTASLHTYNLSNGASDIVEAPVYFRELVFSFKQISPDQVAAYVTVYVRGPDVSKLVRSYAQSKIESNQNKLFELLNKRIQGKMNYSSITGKQ